MSLIARSLDVEPEVANAQFISSVDLFVAFSVMRVARVEVN